MVDIRILRILLVTSVHAGVALSISASAWSAITTGTTAFVIQLPYVFITIRKWQDYVYIQCEYKSTKQKIKHLLREENKVKENKIS